MAAIRPSSARRPTDRTWLLLAPAVLFLLFFFGYPVARLLGLSIFDPEFTLRNYEAALTAPVYIHVLQTTLKISIETTLLCLVLGYPLAYALSTARERVRNLLIIAVVLPYFTSILVRSYAWLVLLGRHGILNEAMIGLGVIDHPVRMIYNTTGVVIGMTHIMLPIMVLALYSVMRGIDMNLVKVSDSLGASRTQTFLRVYFPLSLPGVGAGCLLVFIFSVGFYVTPALLGGLRDTMLAMLIATQIQELLKWGFAGALSLILLVVTLALFLAFNRIMGLDRIWGGDKVRDERSSGAGAFRLPAPARKALALLRQALMEGIEWLLTAPGRDSAASTEDFAHCCACPRAERGTPLPASVWSWLQARSSCFFSPPSSSSFPCRSRTPCTSSSRRAGSPCSGTASSSRPPTGPSPSGSASGSRRSACCWRWRWARWEPWPSLARGFRSRTRSSASSSLRSSCR